MTTRLPFARSATAKLLGPIAQPGVSVSIISVNVPSGSRSPTLIAIRSSCVGLFEGDDAQVARAKKNTTARRGAPPSGGCSESAHGGEHSLRVTVHLDVVP